MCFVMVADERGLLGGGPGAWTVTCGRCEDMARRTGFQYHTEHPPPPVPIDKPPRNAVGRIWLRAFGVRRTCTSCGEEATFVAGINPLPSDYEAFHFLVLATTASAWKLAKHLLDESRTASEVAATIRTRRGAAAHGSVVLSGGCPRCGEPYSLADDPLVRAEVAQRCLAALTSVASAECSVVKWHRALYDPGRSVVRV